MQRIIKYFSYRYLPRWVVVSFDISVVVLSYFLAYVLRFNLEIKHAENSWRLFHLAYILPITLIWFLVIRSYAGILRHSTINDVIRISLSVLGIGATLALVTLLGRFSAINPANFLPLSVIIIMTVLAFGTLVSSRLIIKTLYQIYVLERKNSKKIMIFGAGQLGQITLRVLQMDRSVNYQVIGFIDDNETLYGKLTAGIPVYSVNKAFSKIIPKTNISELIFAIDSAKISKVRKREITDLCLNEGIQIREVPPVKNWLHGELNNKAIREISIEDLLGRDAIQMDKEKIGEGLKHSVALITGAAGSIGSEIVRQLIALRIKKVILFDKAESDLYNLEQEILAEYEADFEVIVGDILNMAKIRSVFEEYHPDVVFNAAAYKHVPIMEKFPCEAIRVNIGGTKILADLAVEFGVKKFVFISTDKAVNPTNVMGATKRVSEIYIQSLAQAGKYQTKFITTRFGNVLGSNGSVVPLFKKQIEKRGPVTVTHEDITRYFMTIPEACQLVLEAGFMGSGGEIFVFDMGEPVKIHDLATKMILLSGFTPGKEIEIKFTGLRPGEKLYEELLDHKEELLPTYNDKIMIAATRYFEYENINRDIIALLSELDEMNREKMIHRLMKILPEYKSENPYFTENGKMLQSQV